MKCSKAQFLAAGSDILCGKHGSVWRRLIAVGLYLHSSRHSHHGFPPREVGNMNKSVIERSKQMGNSENLFTLSSNWQVCWAFFAVG
jgi:hypothetical protein